MKTILEIRDLHVSIDGTPILKGVNLTVKAGEIHAIMGPNGSGKSTLAKVLSGHPSYEVTGGEVTFCGQNLFDFDPNERATAGLFMAFQYPVEIPGVNNASFLRMAFNAKRKAAGQPEADPFEFEKILEARLDIARAPRSFLERSVNQGFSGGEKKKNEILQMAVLDPILSILDETDSGLDIDAIRVASDAINDLKRNDNAFVLITHYQRLLNYITPDVVHVLVDGVVVRTGDKTLALELEEKGYDWLLPARV